MNQLSIEQSETEKAPHKRSFSLKTFCERNGIGLTTAYAEIKAGRLRAHKVGTRTIIFDESEDEWRASLPAMGSSAAA